jgi:hypothetical protein
MFSETAQYYDTLTTCGLEVTYDATGVTGRGLYIGQRGRAWVHPSC